MTGTPSCPSLGRKENSRKKAQKTQKIIDGLLKRKLAKWAAAP